MLRDMNDWKRLWRRMPQLVRRIIVSVVGIIFIVTGALMLITPGPSWATIFLGLDILSTEFDRFKKARSNVARRIKSLHEKAHKEE